MKVAHRPPAAGKLCPITSLFRAHPGEHKAAWRARRLRVMLPGTTNNPGLDIHPVATRGRVLPAGNSWMDWSASISPGGSNPRWRPSPEAKTLWGAGWNRRSLELG